MPEFTPFEQQRKVLFGMGESGPGLRTVHVSAKTIGEAANRVSDRDPAGGDDLQWVLDEFKMHPNSSALTKFKDGNFHFFFGAADDVSAPYLIWRGAELYLNEVRLTGPWRSNDHAVLRG